MNKHSGLVLDRDRPRRRRWRYSSALTIVVGLILSPIVYESSLICVAQWRGMTGSAPEAHTPVINMLRAYVQSARQDAEAVFPPLFRRIPWTPATVIPFAIFWTGLAALLLRKC